ncbi:MAG TPA: GNAT family N-acetyltransferase [Rhizomicrobium sp.]|nr:GNAT family N-acetyltransferase [Rhizomicrobium sp.]
MPVIYASEPDLPAEEFRGILTASTLAERRPAGDLERLERMLRNADIIITARDRGRLIGIARAVTDFSYCCYLSDLAVAKDRQREGIGRRLIDETRKQAGDSATLILVAAPAAESYYPHIGMTPLPSCWSLPRTR